MVGRFLDAGWECGFLAADREFGAVVGVEPTAVREIVSGQETMYFHWFSGKGGRNHEADAGQGDV